jgi:hypothetical protein
LVFHSFLQKVINGGATVKREQASNKGRVDICVTYMKNKYLVELKIQRSGAEEKGFIQLAKYMDDHGTKEGWLLIFDQDSKKKWGQKIYEELNKIEGGLIIHVMGC